MAKVYVNVKLSSIDFFGFRVGGAGLGNILFPWARAVIFTKKNNYKKINATWSTIKIGSFIRREKDKRTYHNLFSENNIGGFKKVLLLLVAKKYNENEIAKINAKNSFWPIVVHFDEMKNQMADILDDYAIVKKELYTIIRTKHLKLIDKNLPQAIGIHVRLGDFYEPSSEQEIREGKTNCRLPLNWYIAVINKIRIEAEKDIHVAVFSDGSDVELKEILALPNVQRAKGGSAISDLLSLSKSKILIASNSTFSLWASYLGRANTIWFPGTQRIKLFKEHENVFEGEIDYNDNLPADLNKKIKIILNE